MLFSVVIATCDRPDRLGNALQAVRAAAGRVGEDCEIVVADNGPRRPAEAAVAELARGGDLPVRHIRSEALNKAAALNAGIDAARGEWLAFTDDDCLPSQEWLHAARRFAAEGVFPVFTGKLVSGPVDFKLPCWLPEGVTAALPWTPAFFDYPLQEQGGPLAEGTTLPYGANLFVKRSLFGEHGGYDEALTAVTMKPSGDAAERRPWAPRTRSSPFASAIAACRSGSAGTRSSCTRCTASARPCGTTCGTSTIPVVVSRSSSSRESRHRPPTCSSPWRWHLCAAPATWRAAGLLTASGT
jgi:hypothetical protein